MANFQKTGTTAAAQKQISNFAKYGPGNDWPSADETEGSSETAENCNSGFPAKQRAGVVAKTNLSADDIVCSRGESREIFVGSKEGNWK